MIVCAGEALFDLFAQDGTSEGGLLFDARIGGSPLNVAMGLARLGRETAFLSAISDDLFGERLRAHLKSEGIDSSLVIDSQRPTTLSVVGVDLSGVPSYAFYGEGAADRSIEPSDLPAWPDHARALHIGSYSTAVEPVGSTLSALANTVSRECFVTYDPNIRPTIEPDMAVWQERLKAVLPALSMLKISSEDLELLTGHDRWDELAKEWLAAGPGLVIVTKGEDGAEAWTESHHVSVQGIRTDVEDTVGAGDTFQAALIAWLDENGHVSGRNASELPADRLVDLLSFATRAAAITCSRRGADLPYRTELE